MVVTIESKVTINGKFYATGPWFWREEYGGGGEKQEEAEDEEEDRNGWKSGWSPGCVTITES